jgi:hypothetical protein
MFLTTKVVFEQYCLFFWLTLWRQGLYLVHLDALKKKSTHHRKAQNELLIMYRRPKRLYGTWWWQWKSWYANEHDTSHQNHELGNMDLFKRNMRQNRAKGSENISIHWCAARPFRSWRTPAWRRWWTSTSRDFAAEPMNLMAWLWRVIRLAERTNSKVVMINPQRWKQFCWH